jgi:penicillin-binding protein 1A
MFNKKKIQPRKAKTFKQTKYSKNKKNKSFFILKWIIFLLVSFLLFSSIATVVLYKKYIELLPPVESIKNMHIAQTSIIYDKEWNELYKIFKENRTYVDYKNINQTMVNALVAWEDQRFWTTPWFDLIWITRAALNWLISWDFRGTSWLSQQLMKVTYLSNERTLERKVKEFYLSWKLNKVFDKEKIVELYLNKIFFWSNAYWIEQASKTFFWINSSDLNILQSSVLASLPKAPSGLSPYNHKDKLLWYPFIFNIKEEEHKNKILTKKDLADNKIFVSRLTKFIDNLEFKKVNDLALICNINKNYIKSWTFRVDSDSCSTMWFDELLKFLNSIKIKDWDYVLEYQTWRKDYILGRMLEDGYIDFETYKETILTSFGFEFKKYRINIENPYFVMYVKDYLEKKYGKEIVEQGWLKIFTTLDSNLQNKAEDLITKYWEYNETKFWAKNSAMVSVDNKTGWILTMVWWREYFDDENGGNNNMITSRLQPWSTFKPFAYALAIYNNSIWSKTPIYDLETKFPWDYTPKNFDWKFEWKMNITTALNNSRNIPAIKMFYLAGGEEKIISFMEKLWVKTLRAFKQEYKEKYPWRNYIYAAPMALWTWLMTPLELAWAYSTFANMGIKKEINPITRIVDRKWNIIEGRDEKEVLEKQEPIIDPSLAYIMNNILSNTESRPSFWNTYLSLSWRKMAAKTGTSTKQYTKDDEKIIAPRNLWTVWYTPQITTVVWAWNTNGKELFFNWNWLEAAGPIMKDFMEYAHIWKESESWNRPIWVKSLNVSSISGLLASKDFPVNLLTNSNFINAPKKSDDNLKFLRVDSLCNWKVTKDTPELAIKEGYLLKFQSISPRNSIWESSVKDWVQSWDWKEKHKNIWNIITEYNDTICTRNWKAEVIVKTSIENAELVVWKNNIQIWYISDRGIKKIEIYLWTKFIRSINTFNQNKKGLDVSISIASNLVDTKNLLKIRLIDNQYYSYDENIVIDIVSNN